MVFDNAGGGVTFIDPKSGQKVGAISTPGALESAATDGTGKVFVNVEDLNEIVILDAKSKSVVGHYPLKGCDAPTGIARAPKEKLLVSICANHLAIVVSTTDGKMVASLPIGGRPDWAGYDAKTQLILVPTGEDGVINLISTEAGKKPHLAGTVTGHIGSRSGAFDPTKGAFYLPSADFIPSTTGGRPSPIAGTFKVLVYQASH